MSDRQDSHQIALQAVQQGIAKLMGDTLPQQCQCSEGNAVRRAKEILQWDNKAGIGPLELLFDRVNLSDNAVKHERHWWPLEAIADTHPPIPYPLNAEPSNLEEIKTEIRDTVVPLLSENWQNLSFLSMVLEKYGSCLSFGRSNVALVDFVKATGAVAAALRDNSDEDAKISLVAGDLSGIQDFIYTISSDGALKSLRARSFYLELLTEEILQQLLEQLQLPRSSVIYAGGANLYLLAPVADETIKKIEQQINRWLLKEYQGKLFLALDYLEFPAQDVATPKFVEHWEAAIKKLAIRKNQKFFHQINDALTPRPSYEPCRVCHRDDVRKLTLLSQDSTVQACTTCARMFRLGGQLLQAKAIVRSPHCNPSDIRIRFKLPPKTIYYRVFKTIDAAIQAADAQDSVFLINDWTLKYYQTRNVTPLLLGNYAQRSEEEFEDDDPRTPGIMRAEEFAQASRGIKRVGYLRMDVDRLGQIFAKGLGQHHSLPRLAGLSRQMSYFFKVYLNTLAEQQRTTKFIQEEEGQEDFTSPNLLFIYAGGDDLFISGSWDEVVDFSFEVYQSFRRYTGKHPDITLSGGISIEAVKFPLYQAATASGNAEKTAKDNGKDSLSVFGQVFKWDEWLGVADLSILADTERDYLVTETQPKKFGVYPFVEYLDHKLDRSFSRSFVRNLLLTAEIQEQAVKQYKKQHQIKYSSHAEEPTAIKELRYYLHLPKVAYTLARLPRGVRDDPEFRSSLLNPYNAPYFRAIATWIELLNRTS